MRRLSVMTAAAAGLVLGGCATAQDAADTPRSTIELVGSAQIGTRVVMMPYTPPPSEPARSARRAPIVDPRCDQPPEATTPARTRPLLPTSQVAWLVRTDFSDDAAWQAICTAATAEYEDGFVAALTVVNDPAFDGNTRQDVRRAVQHDDQHSSVVFIADDVTIESPEHPILVIDVSPRDGADRRPFRTVPSEVWGIENNLDLANMDWEDFERATDADGVFRGF